MVGVKCSLKRGRAASHLRTFVLVGRVVVQDDVHVRSGGNARSRAGQEFLVHVALARPRRSARCEQRRRAASWVMVPRRPGFIGNHCVRSRPESGSSHAQHHGLVGRVQVEPDDRSASRRRPGLSTT